MLKGKRPGHENLLALAGKVTADPVNLWRMSVEEKTMIDNLLSIQAIARIDDIIPEVEHVAKEVLTAAMLLDRVLERAISEFMISQIGEEGFYELLDRVAQGLGQKWVQVKMPLLGSTVFMTAEEEEVRRKEVLDDIAPFMKLGIQVVWPEIVWESSDPETVDGEADDSASEEGDEARDDVGSQ